MHRSHLCALGLGALLTCGLAGAQALNLDQAMGEPLARQMLARFGYGATQAALASASGMSVKRYLQSGLHDASQLPAVISIQIAALPSSQPLEPLWEAYGPGGSERGDLKDDAARRQQVQAVERRHARAAIATRLLSMANDANQAHQVLLSFWLNHFSIYAPKNFDRLLAADYARQLEAAMQQDSFEALLRASFYHAAMQVYLDNARSTAPNSIAARNATARGNEVGINENLARELMELHTLGVDGGYSQTDVQELARIITGAGVWSPRMNERSLARAGAVRQGQFLFDPRRHDYGDKQLLGQRFPSGQGLAEIDRALHLLATQPATARHVSRKLALRFVSDHPSPALIAQMSAAIERSGGAISATLLAMVGSDEFADSLRHAAKFREPLDQLLFDARAACQSQPVGNANVLVATALDNGEAPFMHTTPDGYGSREADWFSPASMARRVRFAMGIGAGRVALATSDVDASTDPQSPAERAHALEGRACAADPDAVAASLGPLSAATSAALVGLNGRERVAALLASPEALHR